jgi:hypothetical protein
VADAGGDQLDGERKTVDPAANLRDVRRRGFGQGEGDVHRCGAGDEELNRRGLREVFERGRRSRVRQAQGRHREGMLTSYPQQHPAGGEDLEARALCQQVGQDRGGGEDMLEVVHHEQDF